MLKLFFVVLEPADQKEFSSVVAQLLPFSAFFFHLPERFFILKSFLVLLHGFLLLMIHLPLFFPFLFCFLFLRACGRRRLVLGCCFLRMKSNGSNQYKQQKENANGFFHNRLQNYNLLLWKQSTVSYFD